MADSFDNNNIHSENAQNNKADLNIENECERELAELKKRHIYLIAEFDNYKKRTEKEINHSLSYGESLVLKDLLMVFDNFHRAFEQIDKDFQNQKLSESCKKHLEGFKLIFKSVESILDKYQVSQVTYEEFNPEFHEAIVQVKSDDHKSGDIVEVIERGYLHRSKLLRPAKVSVAE